mmetsp:Transcript_29201/g.72103  ORF Transcript_29201/g.72103 Transcript_29201/m.72103 type:complete len:225 (-) Transcript_29201:2601-3275(-)
MDTGIILRSDLWLRRNVARSLLGCSGTRELLSGDSEPPPTSLACITPEMMPRHQKSIDSATVGLEVKLMLFSSGHSCALSSSSLHIVPRISVLLAATSRETTSLYMMTSVVSPSAAFFFRDMKLRIAWSGVKTMHVENTNICPGCPAFVLPLLSETSDAGCAPCSWSAALSLRAFLTCRAITSTFRFPASSARAAVFGWAELLRVHTCIEISCVRLLMLRARAS